MNVDDLELFSAWSTPLLADACIQLQLPVRVAPFALRPMMRWMRLAGPVRPVRYFGSVDVFLELAMKPARGEVLVIDNGGRVDESCLGDLAALELRAAGFGGALVWGATRDTAELVQLEWPVFSLGSFAVGPREATPRAGAVFESAHCGALVVTAKDFVFADDDGVIFVERRQLGAVVSAAREIHAVERRQAHRVRRGVSLREQFRFADYLAARAGNPTRTFRQHLHELRASIEV